MTGMAYRKVKLRGFTLFMELPADASLNDCIALNSKKHRRRKDVKVTSTCRPVTFLGDTYCMGEDFAEMNVSMVGSLQLSNNSLTEHAEAF